MRKHKSILTIILCILLLVLGSYILYDKVLNNNIIRYSLANRTYLQAVRLEQAEVLVDIEGNAYLYMFDDEDNLQVKNNIKKIENKYKTYNPKGYNNTLGEDKLEAYKLDIENVLTVYYVHIGNGGFSYFIFIKENGQVSYLSYDKLIYDGEIYLKDIDDLENVISIVDNTYSMKPYAVTSDGNEVLLSDYIK